MGKEYKNIDDLFRSELGSINVEAPNFIKENIDKSIGFSKFNFRIIASILAFVLIGGAVYFGFPSDEKSNSAITVSSNPVITKQSSKRKLSSTHYIASNNIGNENLNESNHSTFFAQNHIRTNSSNSSNSSLPNIIDNTINSGTNNSQSIFLSSNTAKKNTPNTTISTNTTVDNSTTENNNIVFNSNETDIVNINSSLNKDEKENEPITTVGLNKTEIVKSEIANTEDNEQQDEDEQLILNSSLTESDLAMKTDNKNTQSHTDTSLLVEKENIEEIEYSILENKESNSTQFTRETISPKSIEVNLSKEEEEFKEEETVIAIEEKPTSNTRPWMLSLTSGINKVNTTYSSNNLSEEILYKESMFDKIGNQTNFDFTYRLKNGLSFGSGLGLLNYQERYSFSTIEIFKDSTKKTNYIYSYEYEYEPEYIYDDTTIIDTIFHVIDSLSILSDSTIYYEHFSTPKTNKTDGVSKYSYLTIPLHFGTEIIYRKFQFDLFAAARFNFLMSSTGKFVTNNDVFSFGKSNTIYKSFYVDLLLGAKVHYNFWKNLYATGSIKYRPMVGNPYKSNVSFSKSFGYTHFGLGLSIRL